MNPNTTGMVNSVSNGCMWAGKRQLSYSSSTKGTKLPGVIFEVDYLYVIWEILSVGEPSPDEGRMPFNILKVLRLGQARFLGDPSVNLAIGHQAVIDFSDISHQGHLVHGNLACFGINRNLGKKDSIHIDDEGPSLSLFVAGNAWNGIFTNVLQRFYRH